MNREELFMSLATIYRLSSADTISKFRGLSTDRLEIIKWLALKGISMSNAIKLSTYGSDIYTIIQAEETYTMEYEKKYKDLVADFNKLVTEHNKLVDAHEKITNDARSLLQFIEDLCRGLSVYVTKTYVGLRKPHTTEKLRIPIELVLDEGRIFCRDFHNEIVEFLVEIQKGKTPKDAYDSWTEKCEQISKNGGN
jgi:poly(A) polymerase Pap1